MILTLVAIGGVGCRPRSADPMEWKVEGTSVDAINQWIAKNAPLMPKSLAEEFGICVQNIVTLTPGWQTHRSDESNNPLANRFDGVTVRTILIEGNQIGTADFASRIQNLMSAELRLINRYHGSTLTADQQTRLQSQLQAYQRERESMKKRLEALQQHLDDLVAKREAPYQ